MAAWRRKVDELFPELRARFAADEPLTIYGAFFELLRFTRDAHLRGDDDALARSYGFAAWCMRQTRGDSQLWNAAGVAFYEHLFDDWSLHRDVVPWLSPEVLEDVFTLWEGRVSDDQLSELKRQFAADRTQRWRELA